MSLERKDPFFDITGRDERPVGRVAGSGAAAEAPTAPAPSHDGPDKDRVLTAYCVSRRTYRSARERLAREAARADGRRRSMSDVIVTLLRGWVDDPTEPEGLADAPSARDRVRMSVAVPRDLHAKLGVLLAGMPEYTSASAVVRELLDGWAEGEGHYEGARRVPVPKSE
ncbi:MAG: hypothetical protein MSA61_08765 [Coriobacteriaceae bacterium]|uniref:hypothetical protein n=1 Tax=Tractidigestivibacter sp. TaxID=2847320 RepID=UPI002A81CA3A|nr:hypothetical protein [Tractidigestivibacter sp.]MCI7439297.1 hypothetical protein [Coriobacteriaceae bacterium]MDY4533787.1 hypothetical protein [Tractidigestivibacter sp.]